MAFEGQKQYKQAATFNSGDGINGIAAVRRDADTSAVADGQYEALHTNATGRLKVSVHNGAFDTVTGAITAAGQTVVADVTRAGSALISIAGTYATGLNVLFEAYDGVNWMGIIGRQTDSQTAAAGAALSANIVRSWNISPIIGFSQVRIRSISWASPTGTANIRIIPSVQAPESLPVVAGSVSATVSSGTLTTVTNGGVAHGTADSGSPHKIGGKAQITNPTAVADASRVNFIADKLGKQIVVGSIRELKSQATTTLTNSTTETTILPAVASVFQDVYGLIVANTSATACAVAIKDSTGGTTRITLSVPANDTVTFTVPESAALNQAAVNTAWTATCSVAVSSLVVTVLAIKNL